MGRRKNGLYLSAKRKSRKNICKVLNEARKKKMTERSREESLQIEMGSDNLEPKLEPSADDRVFSSEGADLGADVTSWSQDSNQDQLPETQGLLPTQGTVNQSPEESQAIEATRQIQTTEPVSRLPTPMEPVSRSAMPMEPVSRSPTPMEPVSRLPTPMEPVSRSAMPMGAVSRSATPMGAVSRSATPMGAVSRSATPMGAVSRSAMPMGAVSRSATPMGAVSRSATPMGAVSRSATPMDADTNLREIPASSPERPEALEDEMEPAADQRQGEIGRRITDMGHVFKSITNVWHPGGFGCSFVNNEFVKEQIDGFLSKWTFKCKMCNMKTVLCSDDSSRSLVPINEAAVHGILATGGGFAELKHFSAAIDVHCMTAMTFGKHLKNLKKRMR